MRVKQLPLLHRISTLTSLSKRYFLPCTNPLSRQGPARPMQSSRSSTQRHWSSHTGLPYLLPPVDRVKMNANKGKREEVDKIQHGMKEILKTLAEGMLPSHRRVFVCSVESEQQHQRRGRERRRIREDENVSLRSQPATTRVWGEKRENLRV